MRWVGNWPDVRAVVTYSQSTDPDSPHFSDMTQVFSDQEWVAIPVPDARHPAGLGRAQVLEGAAIAKKIAEAHGRFRTAGVLKLQ